MTDASGKLAWKAQTVVRAGSKGYRGGVPTLPRTVRRIAYSLVALGTVLVVASLVANEPINNSGFVPGVGFGYAAITVGGLGLMTAPALEQGRRSRIVLMLGAMAWITGSTYLLLWGLQPGALKAAPMGDALRWVILIGFLVTEYGVFIVGAVFALRALAWLADRSPALRRHNVGDRIRGQLHERS